MRKSIYYWITILTAALLLLAACGPAEDGQNGDNQNDTGAETGNTDTAEANDPGDTVTTDSGLQYEVIESGDGESPQVGDLVTVHYVGTLEDGTEFDSSYAREQPFQFQLGAGEVIPGWDEGVSMMQVGETARLVIPPDLAYGEAGAGGVIPPDATLTFEVELVSIDAPPPTPTPLPPPTELDEDAFTTTESGLHYAVMEEGDGDSPELGEIVTLEFSGWLEDGTSIGSTRAIGQPFQFALGEEEILPAWDEMVMLMQVGETAQFRVPPELAFGDEGSGDVIPPGSTLIFEMELVDVSDPPPTPTPAPPPTDVDESDFSETESGLRYVLLEEGDGETPEEGQSVAIHYRGWLEDGTQFDSSYDRGQPFEVVVGQGATIPGFDEAISLLSVGDVAQIVIPPELAYGEQGSGPIPPDSTLIFEVELVEIRE